MDERLKIEKQEQLKPILETYRKYEPDGVAVSVIIKNMASGVALSNGQAIIEKKFSEEEREERQDFEASEKIGILKAINGSSSEEYKYRTFEIIRELKSGDVSFGFINTKREYVNDGYVFIMTLDGVDPEIVFSNKESSISREFKVAEERVGVHDEHDERHVFQENEFQLLIDQIYEIHNSKCDVRAIKISREYYKEE